MHHFTIAARVHGQRITVHIHIYPTQAAMLDSCEAFNGDRFDEATQGITHTFWDGVSPAAIVRLHYQNMNDYVLVHEIVHAAQVAYARTSPIMSQPAAEHFTHTNEDFAHLVSDLYHALKSELGRRFVIGTVPQGA